MIEVTKVLVELSKEEVNRIIESINVRIRILNHNPHEVRDLIFELEKLKEKMEKTACTHATFEVASNKGKTQR